MASSHGAGFASSPPPAARGRIRYETEPVDVRMSRFQMIYYLEEFRKVYVSFYRSQRFDDPLAWLVALLGFVVPLITADFDKYAEIPADSWKAVFWIAAVGSAAMLLRAVYLLLWVYRRRKEPPTSYQYVEDISTAGDWTEEAVFTTEPTPGQRSAVVHKLAELIEPEGQSLPDSSAQSPSSDPSQ